jgi:DNA-binding MarR family transcriptional regulator
VSDLDKIIHERARLRILTYLASSQKNQVSFNELQKKLDLTSGNLSVQLKKLKSAEYIAIHKTFKDNKPYTTIEMTVSGFNALKEYVNEMESLLSGLKF